MSTDSFDAALTPPSQPGAALSLDSAGAPGLAPLASMVTAEAADPEGEGGGAVGDVATAQAAQVQPTSLPNRAKKLRANTPPALDPVDGAAERATSQTAAVRAERSQQARAGRGGGAQGVFSVEEAPMNAQAVFAKVLAGEFDAEADAATDTVAAAPEKRVLLPDVDAPKLHKVLAQSGIGSRRDMEQFITDGRVVVNGQTAHTGMRISFGDRITVDGKPVRVRIAPPPPRVIAYHKPAGEVVSHDDPQQRPTVFRQLPRLAHGKWQSVGRLDLNTEGLLLLTTSGDLANKLMHPRFGVEREYAVRVLGTLEKEPKSRLLAGVEIEGQQAAFKSIEDGGGEGVNHWYRVVITEGRNREVRKLFDAVGLTVSRLIRIRYGCVVMPRGLKRGVCVDLSEADVKSLRLLTSGPTAHPRPTPHTPSGGAPRRESGRDDRTRADSAERSARSAKGGRPDATRLGEVKRRDERRVSAGRGASDAREPGDPTFIPNPLQQTFDRRAVQHRERSPRDEAAFENGPIPNPLQQTYDRRFVQGNDRGVGASKGAKAGKGGGTREPDPMQTSVGYIGADAFTRKLEGRGGGRRGGRR